MMRMAKKVLRRKGISGKGVYVCSFLALQPSSWPERRKSCPPSQGHDLVLGWEERSKGSTELNKSERASMLRNARRPVELLDIHTQVPQTGAKSANLSSQASPQKQDK